MPSSTESGKIEIHGGHAESEHEAVLKLRQTLLGRTIVDVLDELPTEDPSWSDHGSVTLVFDDGAGLNCGGWGHDAWGPHLSYVREIPDPERNLPVRVNGEIQMMTLDEYEAWRA